MRRPACGAGNQHESQVRPLVGGCTGTAEQDGEAAAPFPQLRIVALSARARRSVQA